MFSRATVKHEHPASSSEHKMVERKIINYLDVAKTYYILTQDSKHRLCLTLKH